MAALCFKRLAPGNGHLDFVLTTERLKRETFTVTSIALEEPRPLPRHVDLYIRASDDLATLELFRVPSAVRPEGFLLPEVDSLTPLARIPSNGLLYPELHIARRLKDFDLISRLITLYGRGRRYTEYDGVVTDYDQAVDQDVWCANIDTLLALRNLKAEGILNDPALQKVVEVGVGGGHISCALAAKLPNLQELYFTDISPFALRCTDRNLQRYPRRGLNTHAFLGKGIAGLPDGFDLLICNPPYIPIAPHQNQDEKDPYRGTGLIRELIHIGHSKAQRVIIPVSGMALADIRRYAEEAGKRLVFHSDGTEVPLKIEHVDPAWVRWLVAQGGLKIKDERRHLYRYWHTLYLVEVVTD